MEIIYALFAAVIFVVLIAWAYIAKKGNAEFVVKASERTPFEVEQMDESSVTLKCKVEMANIGNQCGTVMDCYTRHLLPYEQFDGVEVSSWVELESVPREDGYFESLIIFRQTSVFLLVKVTLKSRHTVPIKEVLTEMVDMPIDLVYQQVTRVDWHIEKTRIEMKATEVARAVGISLAK